ncbi:MAG: ferrous iron transport protein B [Proteobacteria bacterium]|nr:ferrous iron transport protein B [Pseudomonadota bacterium]
MTSKDRQAALAGQPNCGKSTVFNALTGASQHVANYPGVTVDKLVGSFRHNGTKVELVDLPGTYSLTSYSPEERVTRDFLLHEKPGLVINVADASNLQRNLYLTFQLLEMDVPLILNLNMIDVAKARGHEIDAEKLSRRLGVPVLPTNMKSGQGKKELLEAVSGTIARAEGRTSRIDYGDIESFIRELVDVLSAEPALADRYPLRWLAIKLLEEDREAQRLLVDGHPEADRVLADASAKRKAFEAAYGKTPEQHVAGRRYQAAADVAASAVGRSDLGKRPFSDRIDGIVCNRYLGPLILVGVVYLLYYLSIVQGYNLTNYTWPLLARLRTLVEALAPAPGFIEIPLIRAFALWFVDSINALLNYIPIFFILFGLIAILEDSGYMPRMAFIMDRLLSRYGLHGQSTLPMVLGGVYVGGCAVPAVMSCKGIPDERSRLATILIIPLLNCLAKVPLYVLLINIYFAQHKGLAMFFISTISLLFALPISKILTLTVLKDKETTPFIMEMPPYHLPTVRGVLVKAWRRVWLFLKKITTIVAAVAVVIFVLLQFPGLSAERLADYNGRKDQAVAAFMAAIQGTRFAGRIQEDHLMDLVGYWDEYKDAKMTAGNQAALDELKQRFEARDPDFYRIVQPGGDQEAQKANRAFKKLDRSRREILMAMRQERLNQSFLGRLGQAIEPVTRFAGFNWRVNVALLSALAAKESSVATLGALYQQEGSGQSLEQRMAEGEKGFSSLAALALMLFMVLYPPCVATTIAVKLQSGSARWMLFSMFYPMILGLAVATLVYSGGLALGLDGRQAMYAFYGLALAVTVAMGLIKNRAQTA